MAAPVKTEFVTEQQGRLADAGADLQEGSLQQPDVPEVLEDAPAFGNSFPDILHRLFRLTKRRILTIGDFAYLVFGALAGAVGRVLPRSAFHAPNLLCEKLQAMDHIPDNEPDSSQKRDQRDQDNHSASPDDILPPQPKQQWRVGAGIAHLKVPAEGGPVFAVQIKTVCIFIKYKGLPVAA